MDKQTYVGAEETCAEAIKKYNAAKELELIRRNNLTSFYNFVNKRLDNYNSISDVRCPDGTLTSNNVKKCEIFNIFFRVYLLLIMDAVHP